MQQTEKYKLNKPGVDDPIAIAPLNENMDKVDAALAAETAVRTAETAGLDSRVTVLEADKVKMAVGSYTGTGGGYGGTQTISLGFTPKAVFILRPVSNYYSLHLILQALPDFDSTCNRNRAQIVEGGFMLTHDTHSSFNSPNTVYHFVALV